VPLNKLVLPCNCKEIKMTRKILLLVVLVLVLVPNLAAAQTARRAQAPPSFVIPEHTAEILVYGGYRWTWSRRISWGINSGDLDLKNTGFWGIAVDFNLHPAAQLEILYDHQETDWTFKQGGITRTLGPTTVQYLQIGAVKGIQQGKVKPFGSMSLGATRYGLSGEYTDPIDDSTITVSEDAWKFSVIFGLGVKFYASERIGIRAQARLPYTFMNTGLGVGCGFGGCGATIGGTGIAQFDLSAGLFVML
jgi:hypothetical protein